MSIQKQVIKHPYITTDTRICKGSPIIAGTRVRVLDIIIEYEYLGYAPDEIVNEHTHLILPHVHDALSFYYEHREELDQEIRLRKQKIEKLRKKFSS
ncbi:MAG: DUF433 domain-containing protein [Candidatus Methanoperedens sp.]|nr:DUF433 domain-containing protein [Candidatus Methanoperedens sp.]MCZ7394717.1 DUF433 domain-containing protein [Candidatus Methanoperedens sp.]